MDLRLQLLDTFAARGADGKVYKVCAYDRLRRDEVLADGQEHWLSTGVAEYRLATGERVDLRPQDEAMTVAATGLRLVRA